jgi:hypothetical protein
MNRNGTSKHWLKFLLSLTCVGLTATLPAAETGTLRTQADLFAAPYRDAKLVTQLNTNTRVNVLERRGAWIRVTTADAQQSGWVRLHQVRVGEGAGQKASGAEGASMLRNVAQTGRSGSQGIVATTGVRGLSEDQLKNAQPNPQAVQSLDQYRASPDAARRLAVNAKLKSNVGIDFLPNTP